MFRKANIIIFTALWACMPLGASAQFNGNQGFQNGGFNDGGQNGGQQQRGQQGNPGGGNNQGMMGQDQRGGNGGMNGGGMQGGNQQQGGMMQQRGGGPNGGMMNGPDAACYKKYSGQMAKQSENGDDQSATEEALQKCIDDARLKQMKKDISPMTQGISMMKKQVATFSKTGGKCGIKLPEELTTSLASADAMLAKVKAATSMDEMQDIMSDMMDLGETMREWGPKIGMFGGMCQMLKEADNRMKQINTDIAKLEKKKNKDDFADLIAQYHTAATNLQTVLNGVKDTAKTDPETAMESLQGDFFGDMDSLDNIQQQIHMVMDSSQGIKQGRQEYARFKKQIAGLKKNNDVADLETTLNEFKQGMDAVEQHAKKKEFDDLQVSIDAVFSKREELMQGIESLRGTNDFTPQSNQQQQGQGGFNFNIPQSFQRPQQDAQESSTDQ